jgi:peroxiredoxin (alkyl hydroperoxide reductase subunit C)
MHDHDEDDCCVEYGETQALLGAEVDDFLLKVYDPTEGAFGEVSLGSLVEAGKWTVLFFYPADFTFVCPTELADLADKQGAFDALGCEVVSVSTDTEFAHLAWRGSEKLLEKVRFKMGADTTGELSRYFGVYDPDTGLALRGTFIISPEGILVSSEINYYNVGRNADELVRKIKANVYLREHPAEACPARWEPGKKTLTPSEALVGRVYESLGE